MGEIADDMLDGTTCQVCGEWNPDLLAHLERHSPGGGGCAVPWEPPGYPVTCAGCGGDDNEPLDVLNRDGAKDPRTIQCPVEGCERMFRNDKAIGQHVAAKHGA